MSIQKKYQIFVSSTFKDLIAERQSAVEAILKAGHIPAGMELFTSSNKSQWEVIKRWINESDIYMLILGGRYGSVEPESGKSYTQLEYEYAQKVGKPLFAVVITDDAIKELKATQIETDYPEKLAEFRKIVLSHMISFFSDTKDIKLAIHESLSEIISDNPLVGWVRGNSQNENIAEELALLSEENRKLREENQELKKAQLERMPHLEIDLNNYENLVFEYYLPQYNAYEMQYPIEEVPTHLNEFIEDMQVSKYNMAIKAISESHIEKYNFLMQQASINEKLARNFPILLRNTGSLRASNIRIIIKFPDFINVIKNKYTLEKNVQLLQELAYQLIPKIDNPLIKAEKEYEKKEYELNNPLEHFLGLKPYNDEDYSHVIFGQKVSEAIIEDYQKEENISLEIENLIHESKVEFDKYWIVPMKEGEGEVEVFLHCEEYPKSINFTLPIIVKNLEISV